MPPVFLTLLMVLAAGVPARADTGPGAPYGLLCELLRDPAEAVITDPTPELSWIVNDDRRGAVQSAYQILVASSEALLQRDEGDLWDSGKVISGRSVGISYAGAPLAPHTTYWWKVRTWDAEGRASPYSAPQAFHTGAFEDEERAFPGESRWVQRADGSWVLENRQRATYHDRQPRRLIRLGPGHYVADFGRAAFGTLAFTVDGPTEADSVTVYLGERKQADQTVHKNPGRTHIGFKQVRLALEPGRRHYTVDLPRHRSRYPNSQVLAEHMPEVTPFRYAEIVAPPSVTVEQMVQQALLYPFDESAANFRSSNAALDRVWDLCRYTLRATPFLSLYLDGNRERMPYEADAYIQQLGHYAVDREYAVARYTLNFLLFNPSWPTEWHLHTVLMAYADYLYTGDTEFIETYYDDLKAKTLLALAREDGLISTRTGRVTDAFLASIHYRGDNFRDIVDWPPSWEVDPAKADYPGQRTPGERDGYVFSPINTVVNAFHYAALVRMAEMAAAIGRDDEAATLRDRAALVKRSVNRLLFDPERGVYVDGDTTRHASLHANMFPLAFGLVPEEHVASVTEHIRSRGMAASVYGAQYLLEALYRAGADDYALELMTSDGKRSWLNMLRVGATMTTEAWDEAFKPNLTWNHAWATAPANIVARKLVGVEPLAPAFRRVRIRPQPGGLAVFEAQVPTIRGAVEVEWRAGETGYTLHVRVPANTKAEVWLPLEDGMTLSEGGRTLEEQPDVRLVRREAGFQVVEVGGGRYTFAGRAR